MKSKKLISLILVLALAIGLYSCGKKDEPQQPEENMNDTQNDPVEEQHPEKHDDTLVILSLIHI